MVAHAGSRQVLVIEDEGSFRRLLNQILQDEYDVVEAPTVEDGLRSFATRKPDTVLLDIRMPGLDGLHALKSIRSRDPHVSVILMTGCPEVDALRDAIQLGATSFLEKPIAPEVIRQAVKHGVERTLAFRRKEQSAEEMNGIIQDLNRELAQNRRVEQRNILAEPLARHTAALCRTAEEASREGYHTTAELRSRCARALLELSARSGPKMASGVIASSSLAAVLDEVLKEWQDWSTRAGLPFHHLVRLSGEARIHLERNLLQQILVALVGHALLKADKSGKGIRMSVNESVAHVDLRIEYRDVQLDGLDLHESCELHDAGLAMTARMLEGCQGVQQVESAPGKTSVISVRFPLAV